MIDLEKKLLVVKLSLEIWFKNFNMQQDFDLVVVVAFLLTKEDSFP